MSKLPVLRFFSSADNKANKPEKRVASPAKKIALTGRISTTGKLVIPTQVVQALGIDFDQTGFQVGIEAGKRTANSLYLLPSSESAALFHFEKGAKSYSLSLAVILKKSRVDFEQTAYRFTIRDFVHQQTNGLELQLKKEAILPKIPYTGKPRGRKPKATE